jgi:hypothetical protein
VELLLNSELFKEQSFLRVYLQILFKKQNLLQVAFLSIVGFLLSLLAVKSEIDVDDFS